MTKANWISPGTNLGTASALFVIGIAVALVMYMLRGRYGGMLTLLNPAGIISAALWGSWSWVAFAVALIVKTIVFKVGGAPLYEKTLRPLGVGMMLGFALLIPVLMVTHMVTLLPRM